MKRYLKNKEEAKKLMYVALCSSTIQVVSGAEIYRADKTIQKIFSLYENAKNVQTYLLSNVVHISFEFQGENIQAFRRIPMTYIDLGKIDQINTFSRDFVNEKYTLDEAISLLNKIYSSLNENFFKDYIAPGFAGAFFSLLFGGVLNDFISTFFITSFMCWIVSKLKSFEMSFVVSNFVGAFIVSTLAIFSINIGVGVNQDSIIIGSIMVLLPGLIATNSSRDIMYEDYLTGLIGLTKAVFIAFFIAFGVGSSLKIFGG